MIHFLTRRLAYSAVRFSLWILTLTMAHSALAQSVPQTVLFPGQTGQTLLNSLKAAYKPASTLGYDNARDKMFGIIDNKNNKITCVYTALQVDITFGDTTPRTEANAGGFNTEHTFPQSLFNENEPMRSDLHHLFPTEKTVNGERDNNAFAELNNGPEWFNFRNATFVNNGSNSLYTYATSAVPTPTNDPEYCESNSSQFEPREDHKGNAARAMMYFITVYNSELESAGQGGVSFFEGQKAVLMSWHDLDKIDTVEYNRTQAIAPFQSGKANPFILDSTLARRAFFPETLTPTVASVGTPTVTNISSAAATLGATVSGEGGAPVTARGFVYSLTDATPELGEASVQTLNSAGTTGAYSASLSGLTAATRVYFRGYATNSFGNSYTASVSFFTFAPEPTSPVSNLNVTGGASNASLTWTPATGAAGYIVLYAPLGFLEVGVIDGTFYSVGATVGTLGNTKVGAVLTSGSATNATVSNLVAGEYFLTVLPFGYDGANAGTANYYTSSPPVDSANVTTGGGGGGGTGVRTTLIAWTFEDNNTQADSGTAANLAKSLTAVGASASYSYTSGAAGNAVSTTGWDNGNGTKYWQADLVTTGFDTVLVSSRQKSSNTGPKDFKLQYRVGTGGTWTDVAGATVTTANDDFAVGTLSNALLPAACNNQAQVFLRWIMTSSTGVNNSAVATGGTSRMDNLIVSGVSKTLSSPTADPTVGARPARTFSLSQNYPNPFNPETVITYDLGTANEVSLKVFDVLGREVAVLVNERKPAGNYSVRFNAAGLAGGVYFYQLRAGGVAETKKMVLVK